MPLKSRYLVIQLSDGDWMKLACTCEGSRDGYVCGKSFQTLGGLRIHVSRVHGVHFEDEDEAIDALGQPLEEDELEAATNCQDIKTTVVSGLRYCFILLPRRARDAIASP